MSPVLPPQSTSMPPASERSVFQVHELISTLKHGLEMNFPALWVEGEISNFMAARSGHWYFTLKDERGQIRCAFFRNRNLRKTAPQNGQRCLIYGRASIFVARGELQLIVEDIEDAGTGALHLAFERLKRQLQAEGLFASERKQALPAQPRRIGLLTSPVGAALHDVLTTLRRRNPLLEVVLYPIPVQGQDAPAKIINMLHTAVRRNECDVLLLTRGGGSLEDLQAFNDEQLARTIADLPLPLISAIGHEVDFSICDFVADERAATPTAAAERLSRDQNDWRRELGQQNRQLHRAVTRQLNTARQQLDNTRHRLNSRSPQRRLQDGIQQLDDLRHRLQRQMHLLLQRRRQQLNAARQRVHVDALQHRLAGCRQKLIPLQQRQQRAMNQRLQQQRIRMQHLQQRLAELHPDHILKRGYSIVWHQQDIVRQPGLPAGEPLRIQLADGELWADVSEKT